ncbi:hypothetical protein NXT08_13005 [Rhodococcus pyridinivorans]|uniref:Uncharacterized protein n=2 Tax=Rhodococcus TaxID=1827 RepID=V9XFJ0_9NOCA|nr:MULTISPECIES: hypothetical protein [Rhodococcus]AHD22231.1 hypothetical protein Y013_17095 [Rhodococcus pyridinivorans SB3094]AOD21415.1 hypothetical protein IM25_07045 [Rhodococcus sp. p52]APE10903.1 hypothetical protein BO226_18275 [Rhodococcus sp. 2G]MCD5419429.1 hypothetical protein [Rhodococcus pyridinivorans]MCT7291545.1 hypothetical protein [Rhodococcus sp. PAE-6]
MTRYPTVLGTTAGIATAVLAVAAHGAAGGGVPTGPVAVLLVAVAAIVGILGAHQPSLSPLVLLAGGQAATHVALTVLVPGHEHLSVSMLGAHMLAVAVCAVLLTAAAHVYAACGTALRVVLLRGPRVAAPAVLAPTSSTDRLVWGRAPPAISRRGPPLATAAL